MIFVTVGAQMPFDRLVQAVDEWAARTERADVFAQIGPTAWRPSHIEWSLFLEPTEFSDKVRGADVIVAHAGMGSIISALTCDKPILVMPRRGELHETRNDHQVATARRFQEMGRVNVAMDEMELAAKLARVDELKASARLGAYAPKQLLERLHSFINGEHT